MKKLLILGATTSEIAVIERAKKKGIYTIVTDNNTDWSKSPAKYYADEAWDISWSDIEQLHARSLEAGVQGVLAGFSEFRVDNMIKLSGLLNLPCVLTEEQLSVTRDKRQFKDLCCAYGIPVVKEYELDDEVEFPVIIKPVDRAGSIGINVAENREELVAFHKIAMDLSPSKNVVIEKFIRDGIKVDSYYYVKDSDISLLGISDTVMCTGTAGAPILQKAWTFPCASQDSYMKNLDPKVRKMISGIGIKDGYITLSAFYCDGEYYMFEAGFRLSGEHSYHYYNKISGVNYIDDMIDFALQNERTSEFKEFLTFENRPLSTILNIFGLDGKIGTILKPDVPEVDVIQEYYVKEGETVANSTDVFKKIAMMTIFAHDKEQMAHSVRRVNDGLAITSEDGSDMIYERYYE